MGILKSLEAVRPSPWPLAARPGACEPLRGSVLESHPFEDLEVNESETVTESGTTNIPLQVL